MSKKRKPRASQPKLSALPSEPSAEELKSRIVRAIDETIASASGARRMMNGGSYTRSDSGGTYTRPDRFLSRG
jgi:hypothetical protein